MLRKYWIQIVLVLVTLMLFAPVAFHEFVHFDDTSYVTENPDVNAGLTKEGVVWAFTQSHASNWHPLTWISHMLDCQLYGLNPAGHHITNLLFHLANTLLLFQVLRLMTGAVWRSAFVAALFAWHPMHVESVAWVAERKDVLSTFFWLLTMLAYWKYASGSKVQSNAESGVRSADHRHQNVGAGCGVRPKPGVYYGLALVCFALGLLSKPMVVTLPFVLLLLDYWPLSRMAGFGAQSAETNKTSLPRLVLEKIPFFILAAASSVITFLVQRSGGSLSTLDSVPFYFRVNNALVACLKYVEKMVWPHNMVVFYPLPPFLPTGLVVAGGAMLAVVTLVAVLWAKRRPYLAVGWFWFLGTLVPVIGLVTVGAAAMADRYMYVPGIGLFIMVAWGAPELVAKWPRGQTVLQAAAAAVLIGCLMVTSVQLKYWKDSVTLFEHAIAITGPNVLACVDEATALMVNGQTEEAMLRFRQALAIKPDQWGANYGMGVALDGKGKAKEAIPYYREALVTKPDKPEILNNLAWILAANPDPSLRNGAEAVQFGERACKVTHYKEPFYIGTLAAAYAEAGQFKEAVETGTLAYNIAKSQGLKELARRNEELLKLYRAGRPFHGAPRQAAAGQTTGK